MSPRRGAPASFHGLVVVDKPAGWTSHDVVGRCRRIFGQRRIGHSGTLDPDATGMLLVGLGSATRLLRFLGVLPKAYVGEVVLGLATSTLDAAGEVVGEWDMAAFGPGCDDSASRAVADAAAALTGPILQVPPMVSAVSVGGRRLHELAREGIEVEREPRPVTVHRFDVGPPAVDPALGAAHPVLPISVSCSSGTYVRVLAADLGAALGGGAHLRGLRRTSIGSFAVDEARSLEALEADPASAVLSPADALRDLGPVAVSAEVAAAVAQGKVLPEAEVLGSAPPAGEVDAGEGSAAAPVGMGGFVPLVGPDGRLVAVVERHPTKAGLLKPAVVLPPEPEGPAATA